MDVRAAESAAKLSVAVTTLVVAVKLGGGAASHSVSVLGEAMQSSVDIAVSLGVLAAVRIAQKPPDDDHPYGHGKAELLLSLVQMILILAASGFILYKAYLRFLSPEVVRVDWALITMGIAVVLDALVMWRIGRVVTATGSMALRSEVLHLRGDLLMSLGIIVGLLLVGLTGATWLDPLAAASFTLIAVYGALVQLRKVFHDLMDGSLPADEIARVREILESHPEVRGFHNLRSRALGSTRIVDLHVLFDDDLTFVNAHRLAETIEEEIGKAIGGGHVTIHYEPAEDERLHRRLVHGEEV